jgi:recombination protein RecR
MKVPPALSRLIEELRKLPGVGEKTAQRLAFHLLEAPAERSSSLARALAAMREKVRACTRCGNLTEEELCSLCADPARANGLLCVVESSRDLLALEATGLYRGSYHVLMGSLSPMRGVGPGELRIAELLARVDAEGIREVILATDLDVEGEATASYLATMLATTDVPGGVPKGVKVTRIARGLPIGGSLEHADGVTLGMALEGRREF